MNVFLAGGHDEPVDGSGPQQLRRERRVGGDRGSHRTERRLLRLLQGTLSGCDVHDPHPASSALLHVQRHLSLRHDVRPHRARLLPST